MRERLPVLLTGRSFLSVELYAESLEERLSVDALRSPAASVDV